MRYATILLLCANASAATFTTSSSTTYPLLGDPNGPTITFDVSHTYETDSNGDNPRLIDSDWTWTADGQMSTTVTKDVEVEIVAPVPPVPPTPPVFPDDPGSPGSPSMPGVYETVSRTVSMSVRILDWKSTSQRYVPVGARDFIVSEPKFSGGEWRFTTIATLSQVRPAPMMVELTLEGPLSTRTRIGHIWYFGDDPLIQGSVSHTWTGETWVNDSDYVTDPYPLVIGVTHDGVPIELQFTGIMPLVPEPSANLLMIFGLVFCSRLRH